MSKFKYPIKNIKERAKIPIFIENKGWKSAHVNADLSFDTKTHWICYHETEESCWIPCKAFNKRVGYSEEQINQLLHKVKKNEKKKKKKKKNR